MRKGKLKGILKEISYYKGIRRRKLKGNATKNTQRINTEGNTKSNARGKTESNSKGHAKNNTKGGTTRNTRRNHSKGNTKPAQVPIRKGGACANSNSTGRRPGIFEFDRVASAHIPIPQGGVRAYSTSIIQPGGVRANWNSTG